MKLALVAALSAEPGRRSETIALARALAESCALTLFAPELPPAREIEGIAVRAARELLPREHDQVLYRVRGGADDAFIAPLVRALGGTVALDAWALREMAFAAYPALARGGMGGLVRALREGGLADASRYRRWMRGERDVELALNRSVVRFGDAFVVPSEALARRVLEDRNAPTPLGVVALASGTDGSWNAVAHEILGLLERFPQPRTARKPLVALRMAREWRRARERS